MASPKKSPKSPVATRRALQLDQLNNVVPALVERVTALKQMQRKHDLLDSVSLGLYEELDKLAKKAGAEQVTSLVLEQVNDVIREAKELLSEDSYVQRYKEFVSAGDNPEHRDVLVVIRQIRQGLTFFWV